MYTVVFIFLSKRADKQERICKLWDKNEIEDEKHFIFCPLYNHLRTNLFNTLDSLNNITWQQSISVMDKFKFIVQPNSKETALLICKYLKACFEMRKDHM